MKNKLHCRKSYLQYILPPTGSYPEYITNSYGSIKIKNPPPKIARELTKDNIQMAINMQNVLNLINDQSNSKGKQYF